MSMWRCPHCGTPQAETARCWVCRRSSTACGTCRHFRRSVAAQLGYCGLDRKRLPLRGDEIRACWESRTGAEPEELPSGGQRPNPPEPQIDRTPVRRLEFVPVPETEPATGRSRRRAAAGRAQDPAPPVPPVVPATTNEPRWNLWGEPEA